MTIKGTLETFNLRELLQMLAFNQKVGTLVLETDRGARTIHVDRGRAAFVEGDAGASRALLRVVRRRGLVAEDRLERAQGIQAASGEYLGRILLDLGVLEEPVLEEAVEHSVHERFLRLQLRAINRFEFADGQILAPDGTDKWPDGRPRRPIEPGIVVEALLLELTRKMDQWAELSQVVPSTEEVYEGTGIGVDVAGALEAEEVDPALADPVVHSIDGYRTLEQVVEASDVDDLTVIQVVAALLHGGGVRPVATEDLLTRGEDLLSRGESLRALPLLRRAIDRGDAPPEAWIRYADALEAAGRREEAALQLETYALKAEDVKPIGVFDALRRAMDLRKGEMGSAARLTDYYVKNRPWLTDRQGQALEALRTLIHAAVTARQPLEAAERLRAFVQTGDAPSEDLLVLADLYASGGDRAEAAVALFRRAEDLLAQGRTSPARDLLRRTLQLDPTRADARGRLHLIEGEQRKHRQKKRLAVAVVVLGLVLLGLAGAWWTYNQEAGRSIHQVQARAEHAVDQAEQQTVTLVQEFVRRLAKARNADAPDEGLGKAAIDMTRAVDHEVESANGVVLGLATEIEQYQATDHRESTLAVLNHLRARLEALRTQANEAVTNAQTEAKVALTKGEASHAAGRFREADKSLRLARNLAMTDEALAARADLLLEHVHRYTAEFEETRKQIDAARASDDVVKAFQLGVALFAHQLDSDLTREVRLPVHVETEPAAAAVWLGDEPTGLTTPCTFEYSPFGPTELSLRLPGHVPEHVTLPDFDAIASDATAAARWSPLRHESLPEGPRWAVTPLRGPYRALWASNDIPVLLTEDGKALQPVAPDDGSLEAPKDFKRHEPVRSGGTLAGGVEWRIVGQRTLIVRPLEGEPWEVQALGQIEHEPALLEGVVVVVDERGNVYGYDLATGKSAWHKSIGGAPAQHPYGSKRGFLLTTVRGDAYLFQASTGEVKQLASSARGLLLALPLGDGAVLLGGANAEARVLTAEGTLVPAGHAAPLSANAYVSPTGVAWIESDGVHWMARDAKTVRLAGLGNGATTVAGQGDQVYALDRDAVLRAVDLAAPDVTAWRCPLSETGIDGASATSPLLPLGGSVYVFAQGHLVAVAR